MESLSRGGAPVRRCQSHRLWVWWSVRVSIEGLRGSRTAPGIAWNFLDA